MLNRLMLKVKIEHVYTFQITLIFFTTFRSLKDFVNRTQQTSVFCAIFLYQGNSTNFKILSRDIIYI